MKRSQLSFGFDIRPKTAKRDDVAAIEPSNSQAEIRESSESTPMEISAFEVSQVLPTINHGTATTDRTCSAIYQQSY